MRNLVKYTLTATALMAVSIPQVYAAQLFLYPQNIDMVAGGSTIFEIRIDTEGELVNAVDIRGSVENGIIESVTTANSVIDIFIDASATDKNSFRLAGGTPGGFSGPGIIGRISVTAVKPGPLAIKFDDSTEILSGNGESIKDETRLSGANVNVLQPSANHIIITSRSHPDQNQWYKDKNLNLHWDLEDGVEYSYLISLDPNAKPDETPDRPTGELIWQGDVVINGLDDGIYYFTLKRAGEEGIARYRAMIDTTPPEWRAFEKSTGIPETNYQDFLSFYAKDDLSGINHYEVTVDNEQPKAVIAPYILPSDYLKITIAAVDNAGNRAEETIYGKSQKGIVTIYIIVGIIILGAAVVTVRPIRKRIFTKAS